MATAIPLMAHKLASKVLTSPTGTYSFTGLVPGNYVVVQDSA